MSATVGLVGSGWRAEFFLRLTTLLSDRLTLVGAAVRRTESAEITSARWNVPCYLSPEALITHEHPDFGISSVPWAANPGIVTDLVESGTRVLTETPPAPDLDGLRALWAHVGRREFVQVAEQYPLFPGHVARRELLRRNTIGTPTSVQVSSTHGYHAVALIRGFLGLGFEPAVVTGSRFTAPLVDPLISFIWTDDATEKPAV